MQTPLTIFTCSIYPDVTRIWFYCLQKIVKDSDIPIVIYDSSGLLRKEYFPGCTIVTYPNEQHGKKIDHFVKHHLKTDYFFLTDDDAFLVSDKVLPYGLDWLKVDERNAIVSYKPRLWWSFNIQGKEFPTMGSYALLVKAKPICDHSLSFQTQKTNRPEIRNGSGYYDTADYINEQLLENSYDIHIATEGLRQLVPTFFGTSSAMMTFYRKRWFYKQRKRINKNELEAPIQSDKTTLQRAISVAFVSRIYKTLFNEAPLYADFISLAEIEEMIQNGNNEELKKLYYDKVKDFEGIEAQILNLY